jgi:hypothetical protein
MIFENQFDNKLDITSESWRIIETVDSILHIKIQISPLFTPISLALKELSIKHHLSITSFNQQKNADKTITT